MKFGPQLVGLFGIDAPERDLTCDDGQWHPGPLARKALEDFITGRRPVGSLGGLTWMRFDLQPRLYDLRAFGTQSSTELIITVDPGQTRFIQIEHTDPGGAALLELSSRDGRRRVREGQHTMEMNEPPRE